MYIFLNFLFFSDKHLCKSRPSTKFVLQKIRHCIRYGDETKKCI